jgi:multidrug efflux pump subunit AcrA (membrane-fusion protein)
MFQHEIKAPRSRLPLIIGVVAGVLVIASLFAPLPRTVKGAFTLAPFASAKLTAARAGKVAKLAVSVGSSVDKGSAIASLDVTEAEKAIAEAEAELKALPAKRKLAATPANAKLQVAVDKALEAQKAAADAATTAEGKAAPVVAAAKKKQADAEAALARARKIAGPSKAELDELATATQKKLDDAKAEVASANLVAPSAGVVGALTLKVGDVLVAGAEVGTLDEVSKLRAQIVAEGETLTAGLEATVYLGAAPFKGTVSIEGGKPQVIVDNDKKGLKVGATGPVDIEVAPRGVIHF